MYSIDSFITTLWSKHPYQRSVRKFRVNEGIYNVFPLLRVVNFDILESALRLLDIFFKSDLKFCLLSIIILNFFSSETFLIVVSLKNTSGSSSLKPT